MARPQVFDETAVVDAAMNLFWQHGYVDTGMSQILEATGLKPGSFYNTFSNKKSMFLRSLEHYIDNVVTKRIETHLSAEDPLDAIEDFFLSSFEPVRKQDISGCLLTNTATEIGKLDPEISALVWSGLRKTQEAFKRRIVDAQRQGLVDSGMDADTAALQLVSCLQGMCVIGRLTQDKVKLRKLTYAALATLRSDEEAS